MSNEVWLPPVEWLPEISPISSALTRVLAVLNDYNGLVGGCSGNRLERLIIITQQLAIQAAQAFPGNLEDHKQWLDGDQFAESVLNQENIRMYFPERLNQLMIEIAQYFKKDTIKWILPVANADDRIADAINFAHVLRHQKWLSIYLISETEISHFQEFQTKQKNVYFFTYTQLSQEIEVGIPQNWSPDSRNFLFNSKFIV